MLSLCILFKDFLARSRKEEDKPHSISRLRGNPVSRAVIRRPAPEEDAMALKGSFVFRGTAGGEFARGISSLSFPKSLKDTRRILHSFSSRERRSARKMHCKRLSHAPFLLRERVVPSTVIPEVEDYVTIRARIEILRGIMVQVVVSIARGGAACTVRLISHSAKSREDCKIPRRHLEFTAIVTMA